MSANTNKKPTKDAKKVVLIALLAAIFGSFNGFFGAAAQTHFNNYPAQATIAMYGSLVALLILCVAIVKVYGTTLDL